MWWDSRGTACDVTWNTLAEWKKCAFEQPAQIQQKKPIQKERNDQKQTSTGTTNKLGTTKAQPSCWKQGGVPAPIVLELTQFCALRVIQRHNCVPTLSSSLFMSFINCMALRDAPLCLCSLSPAQRAS